MAEPARGRMALPLETALRASRRGYTAIVQRDERWWIGEVAGVHAQGETREALIGNLESALDEALETQ